MTAVGLLGIFLSVLALPFSGLGANRNRHAIGLFLLLLHLAASYVYYEFSLTTSADSNLYYEAPRTLVEVDITSGTTALIVFVHTLRDTIGGTLLDYFFIFQAFGFWGIILMVRTFEEVRAIIGVGQSHWAWIILALPSLHFWTSAIGKDAPIFLACSLAMWSVLRLRSRIVGSCLAIALMLLIRPHIALISVASIALAAAMGRELGGLSKVTIMVLALGGLVLTATSVEQSMGVSVGDPDSLSRFFEQEQANTQEIAGTTRVDAIFPLRLFSLLFRPLFIDATGIMGLIASAENVLALGLFFYLMAHGRQIIRVARSELFVGYALLFSLITIILLAVVYYNVGLGLRQRVMAYPTLFTLFLTHNLLRKARREIRMAAAREQILRSCSDGPPLTVP